MSTLRYQLKMSIESRPWCTTKVELPMNRVAVELNTSQGKVIMEPVKDRFKSLDALAECAAQYSKIYVIDVIELAPDDFLMVWAWVN